MKTKMTQLSISSRIKTIMDQWSLRIKKSKTHSQRTKRPTIPLNQGTHCLKLLIKRLEMISQKNPKLRQL